MREILSKNIADSILNAADQIKKAAIFEGTTQRPFKIQRVDLTLTTAVLSTQPFKVGFPFRSVYVCEATDVLANVNLLPETQDSYQSAIPLKQNDAWVSDEPISNGFLYWSAQSGKTISLLFFVDSEFSSGSQISVTGGGVSIVEGSSFSTSVVDLTAATATLVIAANTARKLVSIQNNTGADIWMGPSTVTNTGPTLGLRVSAGAIFEWRNTAAIYAYSVGGGTGDSGLQLLEES